MDVIFSVVEFVVDIVDVGVIVLLVDGLCFLIFRCVKLWVGGEILLDIFVKIRLNFG